jgi:methylenetetrahydrofolate reductase (NADPH)
VIRSGILEQAGITEIDVAGYPERHPRIPHETLLADLDLKIRLAAARGLRINVVTQFSFAPTKIAEFCTLLGKRAPGIRVYAGMAGPTGAAQLLRYAKICGVSTSLRAMNSLGMNAVRLALHASPDRQITLLAERAACGAAPNLAGVHLFSFGGFVESAEWMSRLAASCGLR